MARWRDGENESDRGGERVDEDEICERGRAAERQSGRAAEKEVEGKGGEGRRRRKKIGEERYSEAEKVLAHGGAVQRRSGSWKKSRKISVIREGEREAVGEKADKQTHPACKGGGGNACATEINARTIYIE
eukprot:4846546-Pleurochrysis_carterae.AAC.3